ncbi:MAG: class I SAM-dependent methyltransferase [Candidatus Omnitrophica bacterium]|nr:class I SAM-dependent methyltransferase [Candidatus Omnitrophota bacterium]
MQKNKARIFAGFIFLLPLVKRERIHVRRQVTKIDRRTKDVKAFFDRWKIYQKAMKNNYMFHREVYAILRKFLQKNFRQGFSLLDLGCGDASFISKALRHTGISQYRGVDLTDVALGIARENMKKVKCDKKFIKGDFAKFIRKNKETYDVIWLGLALHHLSLRQKALFLTKCGKIINKNGCLMIFDPFMRESDDRREYLRRSLKVYTKHWRVLTPEEMARLFGHIKTSDYPEKFSMYRSLAPRTGFRKVRYLFKDPFGIHCLICYYV